jgi:hypothetical protein
VRADLLTLSEEDHGKAVETDLARARTLIEQTGLAIMEPLIERTKILKMRTNRQAP